MTTNKSVGRSNAPQETATDCNYAGYRVDGRTVRKRVHRIESRMEYYWDSRGKNAQNIQALMCPLKNAPSGKEAWIGLGELTRKAQSNNRRLNDGAVGE